MALSFAVMAIVGIPLVKTYGFVNFHAFSPKQKGVKTVKLVVVKLFGEKNREKCLLERCTFRLVLIKGLSSRPEFREMSLQHQTSETLSPVMALSSAVMAIVGIPLVKTYNFANFHALSSKAEGSFSVKTVKLEGVKLFGEKNCESVYWMAVPLDSFNKKILF
ncbi:hypothetical protein CDAR_177691 [Caerostris darwini]|uniref:Uncharacterized protein n=1 Tax=Caerostris darwini TaxID=1538125 RepID=A0AAV4TZL6_9ARAC|nr:hypothetical protein CDAR_177691 [Caerostris darwini]